MTADLAPLVPAYFHPAVGRGWHDLLLVAPRLRAVVVNIASGPGRHLDPAFVPPVDALRAAGVPLLAYIDTDYGQRSPIEAAEELRRYQEWYGVSDVFYDRVSSDWDGLAHYVGLTRGARDLGARVIAFNHGAHPVKGYADHADLLGTFEGDRAAYGDMTLPQWVRAAPASLFFHFVYGVPADRRREVVALARRRNVGSLMVTERGGANPFDQVPASLIDAIGVP